MIRILYRIAWMTKNRVVPGYGTPFASKKKSIDAYCRLYNREHPTIHHYPEKCVYGDLRDRFVVACN